MINARRITSLVVAACGAWLTLAPQLSSTTIHAAEPVAKGFDPHYIAAANGRATFMDPQVSCYSCHRATDPDQAEMYRERGTLKRVTLVETARWENLDFHAQASHGLTTPRAKAMSELLGYDVAKSTQCLNCHSGHQKITAAPAKDGQAAQPPQLAAPRDTLIKHGVSCQACHGPASKWDTAHRGANEDDLDWWKKTSAEKYAVGLLDVRHPRTRAQICMSCHVGSSAEGKIITHEMYAAGHPPLGNFELETFVAGMPYHGVLIEDKSKHEPTAHKDWYRSDDFYRTRSVLTASFVALRMQVQLVHDEAAWTFAAQQAAIVGSRNENDKTNEAKSAGSVHHPRWPELAQFNCASCHHELATDRRAPDRAAFAAPGRPMLRAWPTALYEAALRGSGVDPQTKPLLGPLVGAMSSSPFGRPEHVRDAAKQVMARLDQALAAFEAKPIDRAAALKYLEAITTVGLGRPVDYEEARQLAWGAKTIAAELKKSAEKNGAKLGEGNTPGMPDWEKIETAAAAFDADLATVLPTKPKRPPEISVINPKSYSPALLAAGVKSLDAALAFDDGAFRRRLENLKSVLGPKP